MSNELVIKRFAMQLKRAKVISIVCPVDITTGISMENATHSIEDCFVPRKKTQNELGVTGLICRHCHDSGL